MGQLSPVATGVQKAEGEEKEKEIYEILKATEDMKPIVIYFAKPKDLLAFGNNAQKDAEVDACNELDEDLWKRFAITERAKEFTCVRINTRKADPGLLRGHRVARAPVVMILDFYSKQIFFSSAPKLNYSTLGKWMDKAQAQVEAEVKKLAKSDEKSPIVERAKKRALEIEQREIYEKALVEFETEKWEKAEELFNKAIAIAMDSEWKKKAQNGLVEIKAGKMFKEAELLYKGKRFKECKEKLEQIGKDCKGYTFYQQDVKDLLEKTVKKL
jgi:tetratricopeptide (TPR) repeat protein